MPLEDQDYIHDAKKGEALRHLQLYDEATRRLVEWMVTDRVSCESAA
jgi:hypothetical protein